MEFKGVMIGVIFVSALLLSVMGYISSLEENYGEDIDLGGFNRTQQRLEDQQRLANESLDTFTKMTLEETTIFLIPWVMVQAAWKTVKMFINSLWTIESIFMDAATSSAELGIPIPSWVIPTIVGIITIVILVIIIEAFFKWKFKS